MHECVVTFNLEPLKSLKVHKMADSATLHLVVRCGFSVICNNFIVLYIYNVRNVLLHIKWLFI
jgi:hypothetical protein